MATEIPGHYNTLITATTADTARCPADATFLSVTSAAAADLVRLPAGYVGQQIRGWVGSNGFDLRTLTSGATINNVDCSTTAGAAIPANVFFLAEKVTATGWIVRTRTSLGAEGTAIVPA